MKKLIVLATLAALPAAAMADVVISGTLAVGIVNTKEKNTGSLTTEDRTSGEIKFAAKEDLGNGLKSIWQIATKINLADSRDAGAGQDNAWGSRDSFVGLQGDFGTVKMGNIYNLPTSGTMAIFENNSASFVSSLYDQGTRVNNTVSYATPSVAGFTATVQQSFGKSTTAEENKLHAQTLGLTYEGEGFAVSYAGRRAKVDNSNDNKLHELNASVSLDALTLMAGYARSTNEALGVATKRNGYGVAASYELGNITPKIGFWKEGKSKANGIKAEDGHKAYALGVEYALSKRTRAGVELVKASSDTNAVDSDGNLINDRRVATVYLGTKF